MRAISPAFQDVLESQRRYPAYKLYAWSPDEITISQLVSAPSYLDVSVPDPFDLTPYASEISWSDRQLSFTLVDPGGYFHPDIGAYRRYLKDAAIIRLVEGNETLTEEDWLVTFTGQIHGQIGWRTSRRSAQRQAKITVFGRAETQAFKRRKITTKEYTVGTDLGVALYDICETFMGLTPAEIRIPPVIGRQFKHKTNQLSQVTPWEGISAILEMVCYLPFFDGEGKLAYINKNLNRPPARVFTQYDYLVELEVPERSQDSINKVKVTFLDSALERVDYSSQLLGTATFTAGFFKLKQEVETWWSDDHKQRADNTRMIIRESMNNTIVRLAYGTDVFTEEYQQIDEFHGKITVTMSFFVPLLAIVALAEYIALAWVPDEVQVAPLSGHGFTIPLGRVGQAAALTSILLTIMCLGTGTYEIWGVPYDYAYLEKPSVAIEEGLDYWLENEKEIKNDFIGTHDQADTVAVTELIWEKSQANPRRIVIEDDPRLEPGDIIVLPDGRKMVILSLSKKVKRGEVLDLTLDCSKVLTA